jgi:hypothetical protein
MFIHAYSLSIGAIFAHNPTSKFDQSVMYASRLINSIEKIYTTTHRETLAMVYALHKFKHYLLDLVCILCRPHGPCVPK